MPLIKSKSDKAFKTNVKTLMGEVGKSPHIKSRDQALAIAYATKRRARAAGGQVHIGSIVSEVPGRTDHHPMAVPSGAYVIPAEAVSNLGENNTLAGLRKLEAMLEGSPAQIRAAFGVPERPLKFARGGKTRNNANSLSHGEPVPINAAGGEFVIPPDKVALLGWGDVGTGHRNLDKWVMQRRKNHIQTLKRLPPPAKD